MLMSTTSQLDGIEVTQYLGIARGLIVRSPTIGQGIMGSLKGIVGGNMGSYSKMCEQARAHAQELLMQHAKEMGADGVIGICFDTGDIGGQTQSTEVLCYGTAVKLKRVKR